MLVTHLRAKVELRNHPNLKETTAVIVDRSKLVDQRLQGNHRPVVTDEIDAKSKL